MPSLLSAVLFLFTSAMAAAHAAGCDIRQDADLAIRRARELILIPATLNARQVQMVLDTGSEASTIAPDLATELGLVEDTAHGRELRGIGGNVRTGSVVANSFSIGQLRAKRSRFSLGATSLLPDQWPPVAGLLGADRLAGHDLDLDMPNLRAGLYTVRSCPKFQPWPGVEGVSLLRTKSGLSIVVVGVNDNAVRALLDTGARGSLMTRRLAASLGVTEGMLEADPVVSRRGVSGSPIDVRQHRFSEITLGPVTWRDVSVGIADVSIPGVDMLLGADLLGRQRVWLSPSRAMLWLR